LTSAFAGVSTSSATAVSASGYNVAAASRVQASDLSFCKCTPMPARQICKPKISDSNPDKMFDAVPNSFKHPANLPVDSLAQNNVQTRGRDGMKSHDFGSPAVQKNSVKQFRRERRVPRAIERYLVFFIDFMTRMGKPLRQFAIICEKKQTLSLRVQTPDVEELGKFSGKQIKHSVARVPILSGGHKPCGLVQNNR